MACHSHQSSSKGLPWSGVDFATGVGEILSRRDYRTKPGVLTPGTTSKIESASTVTGPAVSQSSVLRNSPSAVTAGSLLFVAQRLHKIVDQAAQTFSFLRRKTTELAIYPNLTLQIFQAEG